MTTLEPFSNDCRNTQEAITGLSQAQANYQFQPTMNLWIHGVFYSFSQANRELKHATFLSHGRRPEVYCFPNLLVFILPHLHFKIPLR